MDNRLPDDREETHAHIRPDPEQANPLQLAPYLYGQQSTAGHTEGVHTNRLVVAIEHQDTKRQPLWRTNLTGALTDAPDGGGQQRKRHQHLIK